jgi:hypothetical protein
VRSDSPSTSSQKPNAPRTSSRSSSAPCVERRAGAWRRAGSRPESVLDKHRRAAHIRARLCPEGVVSQAARWWLLSRGEQKSADHNSKLVRSGPERERRADRRGHLLECKSESAACLLIARGSHDRQGGGHSRFARAEQRSRCRRRSGPSSQQRDCEAGALSLLERGSDARAGRRPQHRRDKWRCWLSRTEGKQSSRPRIGEERLAAGATCRSCLRSRGVVAR